MITLIAMDASEKLVLRYCFGINILHSVCLAINVRYPLSFFFVSFVTRLAKDAVN